MQDLETKLINSIKKANIHKAVEIVDLSASGYHGSGGASVKKWSVKLFS